MIFLGNEHAWQHDLQYVSMLFLGTDIFFCFYVKNIQTRVDVEKHCETPMLSRHDYHVYHQDKCLAHLKCLLIFLKAETISYTVRMVNVWPMLFVDNVIIDCLDDSVVCDHYY